MGLALPRSSRPESTIPMLRLETLGSTRPLRVRMRCLSTLNTPGTEGLATLVLRMLIPRLRWVSLAVTVLAINDPLILFPLESMVTMCPILDSAPLLNRDGDARLLVVRVRL